MHSLKCPFYQKECILKSQANLPDFKKEHDCKSAINACSFFIKEKLKQVQAHTPLKIIIKQVQNVYLVKADAIVYPTNSILSIDDPLLNRMTFNEAQAKCKQIAKRPIKMGYVYPFDISTAWKIKQEKLFINAVVAGESRLVNQSDVSSAMKKSLLVADEAGCESVLIMPCDNGTHDINLIGLSQLSAIFTFMKQHQFISLKKIFICMEDEETEQAFIEYYNRIFGDKNGPSD